MQEIDFFDRQSEWGRWKHAILKKYLRIWSYKLGSQHPAIVFVDGCAGVGLYGDGTEGSPVLAARLNDDLAVSARTSLFVVAFEEMADNRKRLKVALSPWLSRRPPLAFVFGSSFDEGLREIEHVIADLPTLYFIDPYGMMDLTRENLRPVLQSQAARHELLLRVDDVLLARWAGQLRSADKSPQQQKRAVAFFKRLEAAGLDMSETLLLAHSMLAKGELRELLLEDYLRQFEERFRYLQLIPIRPSYQAAPKYFLLFCTNSPDGAAAMNDVVGTTEDEIWEDGERRREHESGQGTLFYAPRPVGATSKTAADAIWKILVEAGGRMEWITIRAELAQTFGSDLRERHHKVAVLSLADSGVIRPLPEKLARSSLIELADPSV